MQWQYRTILFEFQKDGLLGDKYIDDEEVEALLNEQGAEGWELINVTMIQEGLLAFCKRQAATAPGADPQEQERSLAEMTMEQDRPDPISTQSLQQQEREHIRHLEQQRRETMSALERDRVGEIKIS